jgi:small subunit ribosomal protein S8
MSMTDPIADLLTRIRNAQMARHETVSVPASKIKAEIVRILHEEGYLRGFELRRDSVQGSIHIELKYDKSGAHAISGVRRVSMPGRRVYCAKDDVPRVLNGLGVSILSTSRGVLTASACRRMGVGGEVLCNVW